MVLFIVYIIMIAVTFCTTFIGHTGLSGYMKTDDHMFISVIYAVFWPIGFPISIGMVAIVWLIKKFKCDN